MPIFTKRRLTHDQFAQFEFTTFQAPGSNPRIGAYLDLKMPFES